MIQILNMIALILKHLTELNEHRWINAEWLGFKTLFKQLFYVLLYIFSSAKESYPTMARAHHNHNKYID